MERDHNRIARRWDPLTAPLIWAIVRPMLRLDRFAPAFFLALALAPAAGGCIPDDAPSGLRKTPGGSGPVVVFDLTVRPLPDIPFPNDLVTRADGDAPTGLRVNLPVEAPTRLESRIREQALNLDGFATFGPITIRFDAPLDIEALTAGDRAVDADPIALIDLTEGETFGERIPLDLGRGAFPIRAMRPTPQHPHDPRGGENNLLFETVDEDAGGDGRFSESRDSDGDRVLDRPNVGAAGLIEFYERESNTLLIRPMRAMRAGHVYAVVLTEGVRGTDGAPVRSPFEYVHHLRQGQALAGLPDALAVNRIDLDTVAFAWAFTTQSAPDEMAAIRQGLHGEGVLADIAEAVLPRVTAVDSLRDAGQPKRLLLPPDVLARALEVDVLMEAIRFPDPRRAAEDPAVRALWYAELRSIAHVVAGRYTTPVFRVPAQAGEPPRFDIDLTTGARRLGSAEVPFMCAVPAPRPDVDPPIAPPHPVAIFAHDFGGHRVHMLQFAGVLARWGVATCAIDGLWDEESVRPGLGPEALPQLEDALDEPDLGVAALARHLVARRPTAPGQRPTVDALVDEPRGLPGSDPFEVRDRVRQSVVDALQLVRVIRAFDGRRWRVAGGAGEQAGDFDGDGVVDFGGPDVPLYAVGVGYGGMIATMLGALEPEVEAVVPLASGGGLLDLALRSAATEVRSLLLEPAQGPVIIADPPEDARTTLSQWIRTPQGRVRLPFAEIPPPVAGDRVRLVNLRTGVEAEAQVNGERAFAIAVAADAGDPLRVTVSDPGGGVRAEVSTFDEEVEIGALEIEEDETLVALEPGLGALRQSPAMRRYLSVMQTGLEPADPINYARHLAEDPLWSNARTDVLIVVTAGDPAFPPSTGLALARAAGVLDVGADDLRLLEAGVAEGLPGVGRSPDGLVDPDRLGGDAPTAPRLEPPVRAERAGDDGSVLALRVVSAAPEGQHGAFWPAADPDTWSAGTYIKHLVGRFLRDRSVAADPCLGTGSCAGTPARP
jgi:dienelactone hydrolase